MFNSYIRPHSEWLENLRRSGELKTHAVGNLDTWLAGGSKRKEFLKVFVRITRYSNTRRKSSINSLGRRGDRRDETVLRSTEGEARKAKHTVIDPIEIYIEIDVGS